MMFFFKNIRLLVLLVLLIGCTGSSELSDSSYYSQFLKISLPSNLKVLYTNTVSHDIQDYSAFTVFSLSQSEVKEIVLQVKAHLCSSTMITDQQSCWKQYGNYYTFHQSSQDIEKMGFAVDATITNDGGIDNLLIGIAKL